MTGYISASEAPDPSGHYSQAAQSGQLLFISGQLPIAQDRKAVANDHGDFQEQSRRAIVNMLAVLKTFGGDKEDLVKVTAYIVNAENWSLFNQTYAELMGAARPARSVVPVPKLHLGYLVEVEGIAVIADIQNRAEPV